MAKNLILVNTNPDILKYDNRKAIELAQTLGRPLTPGEYERLKIKSPCIATETSCLNLSTMQKKK